MQVDKISKVIKSKPYFRDEQLHRVQSQHPSYAQCICLSSSTREAEEEDGSFEA